MPITQELIHKLEVGGGLRYFRMSLILLAVLMLGVGYNWRAFRNMSTQEAMDSAQLARNISRGKGYTTHFVRPLSIYLLKEHNKDRPAEAGKAPDPAALKDGHPDLANPPVYPMVLACLMKVLPFDYNATPTKLKPFWTFNGKFWRYQPDFIIGLFNQLLFVALIVLIYFIARNLFDPTVGWLSALLVLGTELFWRFCVSGLSTMLLILVFTALAGCIALIERETREPRWGGSSLTALAAVCGFLVGIGGMTRYSFAWLIIPVVLFVMYFAGRERWLMPVITFVAFTILFTPWVVRNIHVSGAPFGTAGYAIIEGTGAFPEYKLERSLQPDFNPVSISHFTQKFILNSRQIVQSELPKLGGSWIAAFFLVGLMIQFRSAPVTRLRFFLLACLGTLAVVQALGRTQLSEESPDINTENLLVLVAPLVIVYGVNLFYALLDQWDLPFRELRYAIIGIFSAIACLPLILTFLPPKTIPVAFPPYYPPAIQTLGGWMKEDELTMTDIPWALGWYGDRQGVWLTLNAKEDFYAINDFQKPIKAVYLSPLTLDAHFVSQMIKSGEQGWGLLALETFARKQVPPGFPLTKMPPGPMPGWLPEQLLITDYERWKKKD